MRFIANLLAVAVIGLALGGASAWYAIRQTTPIGAMKIGPWSAVVHESGQDGDPYVVARSVAEGTAPIGATEGLLFEAATDSAGNALLRQCEYRIEGSTPPSRLWTIVAYGADGRIVAPTPGGVSAHHSNRIVRFADGSFLIPVSASPRSGNWMSVSGEGPMRLVLRLYDTPVTASAGLAGPSMPAILRMECRS